MKLGIVSAIAIGSVAWASVSSASLITYGFGGSTSDGNVSGSATFTTADDGTLTIVLRNLLSAQHGKGNRSAVSPSHWVGPLRAPLRGRPRRVFW